MKIPAARLLGLFLPVLAADLAGAGERPPAPVFRSAFETMTRALTVTDGDSVRLGAERIRLTSAGGAIDAPEMATPDGPFAKRALAALIDGRAVLVRRFGCDRYGRTIARLDAGSGDIGNLLVARGHAVRRDWQPTPCGD